MVFSSVIFLFTFLPLVLLLYYASPRAVKNTTLVCCSLLFYAWGEVFYVLVMLGSIVSNYVIGLLLFKYYEVKHSRKFWIVVGIAINLGLLFSYKYANFFSDNINIVLSYIGVATIDLDPVHLPLGISFFTFQASEKILFIDV